ncbi:MAG TPA: DNA polymerase III subunit delta [Steroidobacteraceae bacterium]
MKLSPDDLPDHLAAKLLPVYLVSGDEPLLVGEAGDAIRAAARGRGFAEREVFFVERGMAPWEQILQSAQSLSLFAERRIVEIRMPTGRPGTGSAMLIRLIEAAGDDLLVLIIAGRLEKDVAHSDWVAAAQRRGAAVAVWPIERGRLAAWLRQRLKRAGLQADDDAVALLGERTEGNLLAAQQEIDKLSLLMAPQTRIGVTQVQASTTESARFDVFQLAQACASAEAGRALRILSGLRAEGVEPPLVLWSLVRQLHSAQRDSGAPATPRLSFARLIARAARTDRVIKGLALGEAWGELALLTAELCGKRVLPMPRWRSAAEERI